MNRQELFNKFLEVMNRFAQIKAIVAVKDGFIMTTPFTICGSLFLLIACLPIPGWNELMVSMFGENWAAPLFAVCGGTFNILALIVVVCVTYKYVANEGLDGMTAAGLALAAFVIIIPPEVVLESGEVVGNVIPKNWAGSNGIITALLVAFATSYIYCYCVKNHIGIKMPESVPGGVVRAFEALTPGFLLASIIWGVCHFAGNTSAPELVFSMIQTPLQSLTDTLFGGTVIVGLQSLLFWAGIHGPNVVNGVATPMMMANTLDNQALLDAGQTLLNNPAAKFMTMQVNDVFVKSGGCGLTMGLIIASYMVSKSEQLTSLTRMSTVPGIFNINEPIIFGLPIVFNPFMLVPFILVPVVALFVTYTAMMIGFLAPMGAVQVPWTTPPIIAGLLLDGWQGAVIQIINLVLAVLIYLPFVKKLDMSFIAEEQAGNN
ncbi:MAG: PTS transporter subunit EIIC [Anaerovibrio sp.]|uniref:PTS sugar transporter subunit IIC n=1 Tax=Anaerovibrio sp. TaxID=1872532 RepID=UPI002E75FE26|nr:PTS transporter subunit EIIC [Anaerovibrio sp.]MEE1306374.1 PTS transporter subunit EIIC [Anaerovibrio sp.]